MAYCEDCGLTSCYIRGGYCKRAQANVDVKLSLLRESLERKRGCCVDGVQYFWMTTNHGIKFSDPDAWIEYVPELPDSPSTL